MIARQKPDQRWALLPLAAFVALVALMTFDCGNVREVHADDPPELARLEGHQTYAHALAVVTINEAGFGASLRDFGLIHQAACYHGRTNAGRLRWLRLHSRRVLGSRACREGNNCRWSRELWRDPGTRPEAIPANVWRSSRARLFERARETGRRFAAGVLDLEPCPVPIRSWGAREDFDGDRGLVDCGASIFGQRPWSP